jgi:hypothetical protein
VTDGTGAVAVPGAPANATGPTECLRAAAAPAARAVTAAAAAMGAAVGTAVAVGTGAAAVAAIDHLADLAATRAAAVWVSGSAGS